MRQSRSFKEYVENNLDNQMWRAIEEFLPSVDPSVLDLRLNRVRNVGERQYGGFYRIINNERRKRKWHWLHPWKTVRS